MNPMLAATVEEVSSLTYPLLASPKLDGIRAIVIGGVVYSRSLKPIPNTQVQLMFGKLEGYDGELIVGSPTAPDCYRQTMSGVMSHTKPLGDLRFMTFDHVTGEPVPFIKRLAKLKEAHRLPHTCVRSQNELITYEAEQLKAGYEGVILRAPAGYYKYGRSTLREQGMMKLKRFSDSEAVVVGMEELHSNQNQATTDALGYTDRSSHKAGMIPMGMLGALVCEWKGMRFNIGTGFTAAERDQIWKGRVACMRRIVKFKYLEVGMKDLPRHPVFLGWRDKEDT